MADRYRKRLERDLDRWITAGLVPEGSRASILDSIAPPLARWSAQGAAAILGAILLALAALSFVAANWSELAALPRFVIVLGALTLSYVAAGIAMARDTAMLGHALALLGAALFGAGIILTAQTFNISAFHQTGILIWAVGATATAIVLPSRPVLIFASLIAGGYAWIEAGNALHPGPVWLFLPVFAVLAVAASRMRSTVTMNLLGLAFVIWLGHALFALDRSNDAALAQICAYCLCAGAVAVGCSRLSGLGVSGMRVLSGWTLGAAAAALIAAQAALDQADPNAPALIIIAITGAAFVFCLGALYAQVSAQALDPKAALALALAATGLVALPWIDRALGDTAALSLEFALGALVYGAAVTLILVGARPGAGLVGGIGVALFVGQSIYVYVDLFGDLLNTASFFAVGGLLMIVLSIGLTRWRNTMATAHQGADS